MTDTVKRRISLVLLGIIFVIAILLIGFDFFFGEGEPVEEPIDDYVAPEYDDSNYDSDDSYDSNTNNDSDSVVDDTIVVFDDKGLESIVKESLSLNRDLTQDDLLLLEEIHAESKDIESLEGLQYAENLKVLNLYNNKISSIRILGTLTNLEELNLGDNYIESIIVLSRLESLRIVDLYDNKVNDISPLSGLKKLKKLNLSYNRLDDVISLSQVSQLEELKIQGNNITDFKPLLNLRELNLLWANNNKIDTIKLDEHFQEFNYIENLTYK